MLQFIFERYKKFGFSIGDIELCISETSKLRKITVDMYYFCKKKIMILLWP
jgi:hypothetical protein